MAGIGSMSRAASGKAAGLLIELAISLCLTVTDCREIRDGQLYRSFDECEKAGDEVIAEHGAELEKLGFKVNGIVCRMIADHDHGDDL